MADEIKIKIPDAYLEMEPALPPPPAGDMDDKKKTQNAVRKAAATTVFLSAAGIVGYLSGGLRSYTHTESLSVIALFGIFSFGLATLFMSFPRGLDEGSKERLKDPKRGGVGAFHRVDTSMTGKNGVYDVTPDVAEEEYGEKGQYDDVAEPQELH